MSDERFECLREFKTDYSFPLDGDIHLLFGVPIR